MELLDKARLLKYIVEKQEAYRKRITAAESAGKTQEAGDYTLRLMVLDNLQLRIQKGEFDVYSVKDIESGGDSGG